MSIRNLFLILLLNFPEHFSEQKLFGHLSLSLSLVLSPSFSLPRSLSPSFSLPRSRDVLFVCTSLFYTISQFRNLVLQIPFVPDTYVFLRLIKPFGHLSLSLVLYPFLDEYSYSISI